MNKKGQVETQFNWIFVLVVGGVILIFFTFIVLKQKGVSEQKLSSTIVTDLETIFSGAYVSKGTAHLLDVPDVDLSFDCNRFYLGGISRPLGKQVVFAPSRVVGSKLLTWTLEWNLPFKVVNFLFITSPEMRYVFIYDNNANSVKLAKLINSSLPKEMNFEFYPSSSFSMNNIVDRNNYKVRFVFIGANFMSIIPTTSYTPSNLLSMPEEDVSALVINPSASSSNNIFFYDFKNSKFSLSLNGNSFSLDFVPPSEVGVEFPSLFGAIFTDDVETYNCAMRKSFERLNLTTSIFQDKAKRLNEFYVSSHNSVCDVATSKDKGILKFVNDFNNGFQSCVKGFPSNPCSGSSIISSVSALDGANRKLLLVLCFFMLRCKRLSLVLRVRRHLIRSLLRFLSVLLFCLSLGVLVRMFPLIIVLML